MNSEELIINSLKTLAPIYIIGIIAIATMVIIKIKQKEKYKKANIEDIEKLDWKEFEEFCEELIKTFGFKTKKTAKNGDYGVDIIAEKGKRKIAIQCKKWNKKVNIKAIQEVATGKEFYKCNEAMIITNNYFTKNAKELAKKLNIKLIDKDELAKIIIKAKEVKNGKTT